MSKSQEFFNRQTVAKNGLNGHKNLIGTRMSDDFQVFFRNNSERLSTCDHGWGCHHHCLLTLTKKPKLLSAITVAMETFRALYLRVSVVHKRGRPMVPSIRPQVLSLWEALEDYEPIEDHEMLGHAHHCKKQMLDIMDRFKEQRDKGYIQIAWGEAFDPTILSGLVLPFQFIVSYFTSNEVVQSTDPNRPPCLMPHILANLSCITRYALARFDPEHPATLRPSKRPQNAIADAPRPLDDDELVEAFAPKKKRKRNRKKKSGQEQELGYQIQEAFDSPTEKPNPTEVSESWKPLDEAQSPLQIKGDSENSEVAGCSTKIAREIGILDENGPATYSLEMHMGECCTHHPRSSYYATLLELQDIVARMRVKE